jgi:hypothetical protein
VKRAKAKGKNQRHKTKEVPMTISAASTRPLLSFVFVFVSVTRRPLAIAIRSMSRRRTDPLRRFVPMRAPAAARPVAPIVPPARVLVGAHAAIIALVLLAAVPYEPSLGGDFSTMIPMRSRRAC